MTGGALDNLLDGGAGDDVLIGGAGADDLLGGQGKDRASYEGTTADVLVTLNGIADDGADGEQDLVGADGSVEDLEGGSGNDWLLGDAGANELDGGAGDDVMTGEAGADTVRGGAGDLDIADYADRTGSVTVDLDGATGDDGAAEEHDTVAADIEGVWGGSGADQLTGNSAHNLLDGGAGADHLRGLDGFDLADYVDRSAPVRVDLDGQAGDDGEANEHDTIAPDVEDVRGGRGDDILIGDGNDNFLLGHGGADTIEGGAGTDGLFGHEGADLLQSRDDAEDGAFCGDAIDRVTADAADFVEADCEHVDRGLATTPPPELGLVTTPPAAAPDTSAPALTLTIRRARLAAVLRRGLRATATCSESCTVSALLTLDRKTARRLKIARIIGRGGARIAAAGSTAVVVKIGAKARRRLARVRSVKATLRITATDAARNAVVIKRQVRITR